MLNKWLTSLALCVLSINIAVAQIPVVPTSTYGPPSCSGVPAIPSGDRVAIAHKEQQEGARDISALPSAEPLENFDLVRDRLSDYANCTGSGGCYWADLDAQYRRASQALALTVNRDRANRESHRSAKRAAEELPSRKMAVVFDIDETVLSSYCEMRREDFGYIASLADAWTVSPEAAVAIPGALRLFNQARADGLAVFFITGRPGLPDAHVPAVHADQTAATERNLAAAGFHGWTGLALRNGPENQMPTIAFKSSERQKIVAQGYHIVLSVGDQWSDLLGDPKADISVKLPDPFYFIP